MMKRYTLYIWMLIVGILITTSCTDNDFFSAEEEIVNVTYNIGFSDNAQGRALDDEAGVNQLSVGVYEGSKLVGIYGFELEEGKTSFDNVKIPLLKERTYTLLFWAQIKESNTFYTLDFNTGTLTVDYGLYDDISLAEAESFKTFYTIEPNVTIVKTENEGKSITLSRPFSQLNIAVKGEELSKVQRTSFTINQVYSQMNLLKEEMIGDLSEEEFSFCLSDAEKSNPQTIEIEGSSYNYVASAYLLAPGKVNLNGSIDGGEGTIPKELSFTNLSLQANYRTNIYGDLVIQEEMKGWDGSLEFPEDYQLTKDAQNRYIIDEEMDLAWLSLNASSLSENATFIVTKDVLDMGGHTISSIQLPDGSTFDGDGKTIKNYANSLFGNATNLTVRNLVLDNVHASSEGHVGVLVNTLTGSSTFTGVTVSNSSATTDSGAAGGIVGYIVRNTVDDRTETLTVTFSNCDLVGVTAKGLLSEGKFVGLLSGYDNGETLAFDADCSAENTSVTDFVSSYQSVNQSVWLDAVDTKFDGWLGTETYRRGVVNLGGKRLVPKWDGTTTVEPLAANINLDGTESGKVIYSPADLAWFQEKNYTSTNVYLRSDLDMGGSDAENAPIFKPISTMKYLDGLKKGINQFSSFDDCYKIHNLKIVKVHANGNGAAFILTGSGGHLHQNLVFDNSCIISKHDETITDIDDSDYGNAYAGTVVCRVTGAYTVQNVLIQNGSVSGVCKMGGLLGYCSGNLNATNCVVDGCTIINYDPQCINWYYQKEEIESLNMIAYAKDSFYTDGECGGLIGFISSCSPTITDCSVINTVINCTGELDKSVYVGVYGADNFDENNLPNATVDGNVTIAGRHVNQFIGDIRTTASSNTITITNPYVENNTYTRDKNEHYFGESAESKTLTKEEVKKNWGIVTGRYRTYACSKDYYYSSLVGCAYVVAVTIEVLNINKHVGDYKGTISISNGKISPTINQTDGVTTGKEYTYSGLLPDTWDCTYNWTYNTIYNPTGQSTFTRFVGDDFRL